MPWWRGCRTSSTDAAIPKRGGPLPERSRKWHGRNNGYRDFSPKTPRLAGPHSRPARATFAPSPFAGTRTEFMAENIGRSLDGRQSPGKHFDRAKARDGRARQVDQPPAIDSEIA